MGLIQRMDDAWMFIRGKNPLSFRFPQSIFHLTLIQINTNLLMDISEHRAISKTCLEEGNWRLLAEMQLSGVLIDEDMILIGDPANFINQDQSQQPDFVYSEMDLPPIPPLQQQRPQHEYFNPPPQQQGFWQAQDHFYRV